MSAVRNGGAAEAEQDRRFMAAAIRFSARHSGLTSTNPSVATLIVRDAGAGPVVVGRGVTAIGGRPHAETQAIEQAGERARGATAYVTLEPCAHHGRTPPCAHALVTAGVTRVVGAASDPDPRVSGRGYAIIRAAGIDVTEGVLAETAGDMMAGYLMRSVNKRPEVTLKLAISSDSKIGRQGEEVAITGPIVKRQVHVMRAQADAVLIGIETALADDPDLTVRLPGLEQRSPARIVLDRFARLPSGSRLAQSATKVPVWLAAGANEDEGRGTIMEGHGIRFLATEKIDGRIALPELLEDLAALGMSRVLVEGGARTARHFLDEDLVDRIVLFQSPLPIGQQGIAAPIDRDHIPDGFRLRRSDIFGPDLCFEWTKAT